MRRVLQVASLAQVGTARPRCSSLSTVLRRQLKTKSKSKSKSKSDSPERIIDKYSIEYVKQMADEERVSMLDHSKVDALIAAKEEKWRGKSETDWFGRPVFLRKMIKYGKKKFGDPWDAIQAQYFYLNRKDLLANEEYHKWNALHWCVQFPPLTPMMKWLMEDGNILPNKGDILHTAVMSDNLECTALLLNDKRVKKDEKDKHGATPLMYAALKNQPKIVSLLLKHGCNKYIKDDNGATALKIAEQNKFTEVVELLR